VAGQAVLLRFGKRCNHGLAIAPLYDEPFVAAVPSQHPLSKRKSISAEELKSALNAIRHQHGMEAVKELIRTSKVISGDKWEDISSVG